MVRIHLPPAESRANQWFPSSEARILETRETTEGSAELHTGDGPIDVSLRKPVDDYSRATLRKATGDGKADTTRRAGDDRSHA
jgi:hypothetical protein